MSKANFSYLLLASVILLLTLHIIFMPRNDVVKTFPQRYPDSSYKKENKNFSSKTKYYVNNSGAEAYLAKYDKLFHSEKENPLVPANPNVPETITTWWQAAAMIDWYIRGPLRYQCKNVTGKGNWHICQDERFAVKPPCLVYSFGPE